MAEKKILILMRGGTGSTALAHFFLARGYKVLGLHYDYGQPAADHEKSAVRAVAEYYGFEVELHNLSVAVQRVGYEFICRNALLVFSAVASFGLEYKLVGLGIHSGTPYYDCSRSFADHLQLLLDGYFHGIIQLEVPFIDLTKQDILSYCQAERVPVHLTYSCDMGARVPCGSCPSCRDRLAYDTRQ